MNIITDFKPSDFVTPYFRYSELCCQECLKQGKLYFVRDDNFLFILNAFRNYLNSPMIVTSGTRCDKHNPLYSLYYHSYHTLGQALDFYTPTSPLLNTFDNLIRHNRFNGIGIYPQQRTPFLHIDIRNIKYYWLRYDNKDIPLF